MEASMLSFHLVSLFPSNDKTCAMFSHFLKGSARIWRGHHLQVRAYGVYNCAIKPSRNHKMAPGLLETSVYLSLSLFVCVLCLSSLTHLQ